MIRNLRSAAANLVVALELLVRADTPSTSSSVRVYLLKHATRSLLLAHHHMISAARDGSTA